MSTLGPGRRLAWPASLHLALFAVIIAVPLLILLGALLHRSAAQERQRIERLISQQVDALVASIDRDIERRILVLQTLATAPSLRAEDWAAFYAQAKASLGRNYLVMVDAEGRQVVNTYVAFGEAPAVTGDPATLELMRRAMRPVVSDLFQSLVTRTMVYNVSIPVTRDGELRYLMSFGLYPEDLLALLQDQHLEPEWTAAVWDRNGAIMAHSRAQEAWMGKAVPDRWRTQPKGEVVEDVDLQGERALAHSARSRLAGWTIRVAVPARLIESQIRRSLWFWGLAAGVITLLTAGAAFIFARTFTRPLAATARAAAALGQGKEVTVRDTDIAEVNAVNQALRDAQQELDASRLALRYSERLLSTAADAAQFGAHQYDAMNDKVYRSPQIRRILGAHPDDDRDFESAQAFVHPEDREHVRWRKRQVLESEDQYQLTYRIRQPGGEVRWVMDRGQVERDPSGKALRVIGVLLDITDLKAAEQRQRLLFDELSHRVKNTLSIVQSLAQQTLRSTPEPQAFAPAFGDRLASLSRAHDLLTQSAWRGAPLEKIVAAVLEPFTAQSGRVEIEGPSVDLPANLTISIALMLHELATNAAKYGALAGPGGRVDIAWKAAPAGDGHGVDLLWQERGGPSILPPQRRGFGTRLLAASAQQIKGELEMAFPPEGLVCRLRFTVPRSPPLEYDGTGSVA